ncbi:uncharacterized protein LOC126587367 isoform X2 [Malus sylvestris]|uniref:uncharacterized protein LOC126587367 isoform X2 n=1 Tax=Malus sylvestris TaxID=3752 RepID=UPI0021ACA5C5|nr:uncharacterized protein LOC126587367 isoform X2 [Malus sylvestris]
MTNPFRSHKVSMDLDGLPDGDEMHSSDDVNEAKKRRGRGPTMLDYNVVSKAKQIGVQFNDKGQHFGAGSASLSSSAGILARQLIPVTYASWDEVPRIFKDKLWVAEKLQPVGILRGSSCKLLNWLRNGQVVATGEIESTNPEAKVHHMVLGPDCWKVWVTVVKVKNISLYRPTSEFRVLEDAISSTIAWPSKYVQVGE